MYVTNGPNAIEHADADCHCTASDQLRKTDTNALPLVVFSSQNTHFLKKTNDVNRTHKYRDNVISINTVIKSSQVVKTEQVKAVRMNESKFIYPMLECS